MRLLEISDLESGYGKLRILHGISLYVADGEIVALFGPNGAGKTTLAKAIFGLLPRSRGSVTFDGLDLGRRTPESLRRLRIAYVPQERNVFPALSVQENLKLGLVGVTAHRISRAIDSVLENFPALRERRHQKAALLSGGERQMLAIASAFVSEPRFLVLDEPTSGLAPVVVGRLIERTLAAAQAGTTILWIIGDDPTRTARHAHRSYLLQSGMIGGEWSADELTRGLQLSELYFDTDESPSFHRGHDIHAGR